MKGSEHKKKEEKRHGKIIVVLLCKVFNVGNLARLCTKDP